MPLLCIVYKVGCSVERGSLRQVYWGDGGLDKADNRRVWVKWYLIAALMLLFAFLCLFLFFHTVDEIQEQVITAVEQELERTASNGVSESVKEEVQRFAWQRKLFCAALAAVFFVAGALLLAGMRRQLTKTLKSAEESLGRLLDGDLSGRPDNRALHGKGDAGGLLQSVERLRKDAGGFVADIRGNVLGALQLTGKIDLHMKGLSRGMREVALAADELSYYMEETASEASRLHGCCEELQALSGVLGTEVSKGEALAKDMKRSADLSKRSAMNGHEAATQRLEEQKIVLTRELEDVLVAEQILGFTVPVMGILEQINLQSLQAGMEASKMGEQGRKFSGTADEIRSLVEQARGSLEKIRWSGSKSGSAVVSFKRDVAQMFQWMDDELETIFGSYGKTADLYGMEAEKMGEFAGEFEKTAKRLGVCAEKISSSASSVDTKIQAGGVAGTKGIADKTKRASAKMDSMAAAFEETTHAAKVLDERIRPFVIDGETE